MLRVHSIIDLLCAVSKHNVLIRTKNLRNCQTTIGPWTITLQACGSKLWQMIDEQRIFRKGLACYAGVVIAECFPAGRRI